MARLRRAGKKLDDDSRVWDFCDRFNREVLWRSLDFPRALAVRVKAAELLRADPSLSADSVFVDARYAAGPVSLSRDESPGSQELDTLFSVAFRAAQSGVGPREVAESLEPLLPHLPAQDLAFATRWLAALGGAETWGDVPRMTS